MRPQAAPSAIKLGRATPQQRNSPLSLRLAKHVPAFEKALAVVNEKWGRTILHENLLIARVRAVGEQQKNSAFSVGADTWICPYVYAVEAPGREGPSASIR